jgi:hypothetical protein
MRGRKELFAAACEAKSFSDRNDGNQRKTDELGIAQKVVAERNCYDPDGDTNDVHRAPKPNRLHSSPPDGIQEHNLRDYTTEQKLVQ